MQQRTTLFIVIVAMLIVLCANLVLYAFTLRGNITPAPVSVSSEVSVRILAAPDCTECFDPEQYLPELERLGVTLGNIERLDGSSSEKVMERYGITRLPALVLSKELGSYPELATSWDRIGTIAKDGSYVLQGVNPPYFDVEEKTVRGMVELILLQDSSCTGCYDASVHQQILGQLSLVFSDVRSVDISSAEGQALIAQYGITSVPTALLRGDYLLYPGFEAVWPTVGSFAEDGTAVFTNLDALELPYKNLSSGELVTPAPAAPAAS